MTISDLIELLEKFGMLPIAFIIILVGLFKYWMLGKDYNKDNNSLFDIWIISGIFSLIVSRVVYIIVSWNEFANLAWFYLPYERYGKDIYLFRLMPWKLFQIFDGKYSVLGAFIGFYILFYLLVIFYKKWNWRELYKVFAPPLFMTLSAFVIAIDLLDNINANIFAAYSQLASTAIYLLILKFSQFILKGRNITYSRFVESIFIIYLVLNTVFTVMIFTPYLNNRLNFVLIYLYIAVTALMVIKYYSEWIRQLRGFLKEKKIKDKKVKNSRKKKSKGK